MNVEFSIGICKETVGLVTSVVLGPHPPVYVGEYGLFFKVYCAEYSTAYFDSSLMVANKEVVIYQFL